MDDSGLRYVRSEVEYSKVWINQNPSLFSNSFISFIDKHSSYDEWSIGINNTAGFVTIVAVKDEDCEDSGVHFTVDKQPEALRLAADWSVLFKNGMLDAEDIQDITDEFRRLHALCDEMGEALQHAHHVIGHPDCQMSKARAELIAKWKESK